MAGLLLEMNRSVHQGRKEDVVMHIRECAGIAFRNLMVAKKMSIKIVIGLSAIIMLLFCIVVYQKTFDDQMEAISAGQKSDCYLQESYQAESIEVYQEKKESIFANQNDWKIDEVSVMIPVSVKDEKKRNDSHMEEEEQQDYTIEDTQITVNGKVLKGKAKWLTNMQEEDQIYETDILKVDFYDRDFSVFSRNVTGQYQKETGKEHYVMGSLPQKEGEVMVSDYFLERFGMEETEQEQLLGKKISLAAGKKGNRIYFKDYILSGIFDAEILSIREKHSFWGGSIEHVMVNFREEDQNHIIPDGITVRYYQKNFAQLTDSSIAAESRKEVEMSVFGKIYSVMDRQISVINKILECVIIGFVIAVTIYITSIMYFFFDRNKVYFVMLRAIGIRKQGIYRIMAFEAGYLVLCAMIIGGYLALLILLGLKKVYEYTIGFDFEMTLPALGTAAFAAFAYCAVICLAEGIFYCKNIMKKNISEVLKCEKAGKES